MINIFLKLYSIYLPIKILFYKWIGQLMFVYYVNDIQRTNITFNYFFNYNLKNFKNGTYYLKIHNGHGTNHFAFNGELSDIKKICIKQPTEILIKRKNIILLENNLPLNVDLELLDNYKINMEHFGSASVTNLSKILAILDLKCSHVAIIKTYPFSKTILEIKNININDLYTT